MMKIKLLYYTIKYGYLYEKAVDDVEHSGSVITGDMGIDMYIALTNVYEKIRKTIVADNILFWFADEREQLNRRLLNKSLRKYCNLSFRKHKEFLDYEEAHGYKLLRLLQDK